MLRVELYRQDAQGKVRTWIIEEYENGFTTYAGLFDGELVETDHPVPYGKASRTQEEQIHSEMQSQINKRLDTGYCRSFEEAKKTKPTNALGYPKPMLAQRFDKLSEKDMENLLFTACYVQRKYNGHRCMIINDDGINYAYSRNGKLIHTIDPILADLDIPNGTILDGELYCHGESLQRISSWAKRFQENTEKLVFIAYDMVTPDPYNVRLTMLKDLGLSGRCQVAPTQLFRGEFSPIPLMKIALQEGYEGLILRAANGKYEDGKRSKYLIKLKHVFDDEFLVIDIKSSKDGLARLVCVTSDGKKFGAFAPGNHSQKRECLENKDEYIGRKVKLEYYELTDDEIPFHPIAVMWRDKESE